MANTYTQQNFESSVMDMCLSNSLGYLSLEAPVPIPRVNRRNNSMCDSGVSLGEGSLDSLLGDLLHAALDDDRARCANCDEATVAARCRDCCDLICERCIHAHRRSRFTKSHTIVRLSGDEPVECDRSPELAREVTRLLAETRSYVVAAQRGLDATREVAKAFEADVSKAAQSINDTTRAVVKAAIEREHDLLDFLEYVRVGKITTLRQHGEELCSALTKLRLLSEVLTSALERGSTPALWQAHSRAMSELLLLRAVHDNVVLNDEGAVSFLPPDAALLQAVRSMGRFASGVTNDLVQGNAKVNQGCSVSPRDYLVERCGMGLEALTSAQAAPDKENNRLVSYPRREGLNGMHVTLRGLPDLGSPFALTAQQKRDYRTVALPKTTFCTAGEEPGELCRPWGICCDAKGNFIVADRSNNRIQVFHPDGTFSFQFGSLGSGAGQLDRPSSVATNHLGHIVVADKDNHRIQVFSASGEFLFKFGQKGGKPGQFNYPWDVSCDRAGRIVVSDTRNHRVQLFGPEGDYLDRYGFEGQPDMWKHFDSPRGVCFDSDGRIMVTDFNNHRLVIVDADLRNARFLGREGSGPEHFRRPQGVVVDGEGRILVADSRNNRVQVFERNGGFLHQFGTYGQGVGEVDRPSGICLTPDGKIAVVDFGNNRIHVY